MTPKLISRRADRVTGQISSVWTQDSTPVIMTDQRSVKQWCLHTHHQTPAHERGYNPHQSPATHSPRHHTHMHSSGLISARFTIVHCAIVILQLNRRVQCVYQLASSYCSCACAQRAGGGAATICHFPLDRKRGVIFVLFCCC